MQGFVSEWVLEHLSVRWLCRCNPNHTALLLCPASLQLQTTEQYDTFGSTAAELARRAARDAATSRPSAIPGLLPDELVAPVADSVGVRLLQRMGWRQGKGVGAWGGGCGEQTYWVGMQGRHALGLPSIGSNAGELVMRCRLEL